MPGTIGPTGIYAGQDGDLCRGRGLCRAQLDRRGFMPGRTGIYAGQHMDNSEFMPGTIGS